MPRLRLLSLAHLLVPGASCAAAAFLVGLTGCTPQIGDHCNLNTDCSLQGTLVCDNAQTNGYCTEFNCAPDTCQDSAVCVMLYSSVPGCPYNGYQSPSRTQRTLCLKACTSNSNCRTSEGYECANPQAPPWNALILDDNQNQMVCMVTPEVDAGVDSGNPWGDAEAPVCMPEGPVVPPISIQEAGAPDAPGGG